MSFYGNNIISHIPRSHFDIALTVANRAALDNEATLAKVNMYDYILVDYNHGNAGNDSYNVNKNIDAVKYFDCHNTIWQKGYKISTEVRTIDGEQVRVQTAEPGIIAIARLNSVLPTYYLNNNPVIPVIYTMNQIPLVVNEPLGYDNFGVATDVSIPTSFTESGTINMSSTMMIGNKEVSTPIEDEFTRYGTDTYTYLTK